VGISKIKSILMSRDGMSSEEANKLIGEALYELNERLLTGDLDSSYDICEEYFGLEPDYLMELVDGTI
jgi:hypothetical protein